MTDKANAIFVGGLWAALILAWLFSGEQFLDLMFSIPDAGEADDAILTAVIWLEDWRAALSLPDLFAALRGAVHRLLGLG